MRNKQENINITKRSETVDKFKRNHLKWMPPLAMAVVLPTHAQTSPACSAKPIATGSTPTCKLLQALEGNGTMSILSDSDSLEIVSISHNAPSTDTITLPAVPATVTNSSGILVVWKGPALDAATCLPINDITITVTYNCNDDANGPFSAEFSLTAAFGG